MPECPSAAAPESQATMNRAWRSWETVKEQDHVLPLSGCNQKLKTKPEQAASSSLPKCKTAVTVAAGDLHREVSQAVFAGSDRPQAGA